MRRSDECILPPATESPLTEIIGHVVEHIADAALLDPAIKVAAGVAHDQIVRLLGPRRFDNLKNLADRLSRKLKGKKIDPPPSLSTTIPILEAARDESREELLELWASLLAAACDPDKRRRYRREFVDIVKKMEPLDAVVLPILRDSAGMSPTRRDYVAGRLKAAQDEIEVSFLNLQRLGLISEHEMPDPNHPYVKPLGRELLLALQP